MEELFLKSQEIFQKEEAQSKVNINSFTLLKVIGKGSYAKVVLVKKKDNNKIYAMKILKKDYIRLKKQVAHIKTERSILAEIYHPFIVKLNYAFQSEKKLFFVLDYCPGGELFNLLSKKRRFAQEQAKFYAAQIVLALDHLHSMNIIYRDLKPENVLIDKDGYIKLTDFGLSKKNIEGNTGAYSICGTPEYLAPEILKRVGHGKAADWWTFGALIYEMITGLPPFYTSNREILYDRILNEELQYPGNIDINLKRMLEGLFMKKPKERLGSLKGAEEIKKQKWFENIDWNLLMEKKIMPPFVPVIANEIDVSNFDTEFTESALYSPKTSINPASFQENEHSNYENFSFAKSMSIMEESLRSGEKGKIVMEIE